MVNDETVLATERVAPAVGQIWADNDWRSRGRTFRIDSVAEAHAICTILTNVGHDPVNPDAPNMFALRDMVGKQTKILLRRFKPNSTGYRYLRDAVPSLTEEQAKSIRDVSDLPPLTPPEGFEPIKRYDS